ncbi:uncharacterized protein LOC131958249 [Physella acuta]|uniref:uncharacterized protein LOC131958249 n=1 Tax=Physella acuta TaxID=109671 RepID=UPI0027DE2B4F|nr:uncharacterized protein LOC131958249 [Physella acuta]XP_059179150.1 uncharacterized protein LOC131958249 [Physella acuta]XP_059179151.1 uncharacterized protein LOC131958249 [Physella acuta]
MKKGTKIVPISGSGGIKPNIVTTLVKKDEQSAEQSKETPKKTALKKSKDVSKEMNENSPKSVTKTSAAVHEDTKSQCTPKMESTIKKEALSEGSELFTPSSAVRRSGRAPVPSSKFKDMEVDLVAIRKRISVTNMSEESEPEQEVQKKRSHTQIDSKTESAEPPKKRGRKPKNKLLNVDRKEVEVTPTSSEESVEIRKEIKPEIDEKEVMSTVDVENKAAQNIEQAVENKVLTSNINESMEVPTEVQSAQSNLPTTIELEGQHITLTEKDGETIAIITMVPNTLNSDHTLLKEFSVPESNSEFDKTDTVSLKHGHIVGKKPDPEPTFATVVEKDGNTYLNLSVEPTKISSVLKGIHQHPKASNPVAGHGRVVRSGANLGSVVVKTTLLQPSIAPTVTTPGKEPHQAISILEPKTSTTYSLLLPKLHDGTGSELTVQKNALHGSISPTQTQQKLVVVRQPTPNKTILGTLPKKTPPPLVCAPQNLPTTKDFTTVVQAQKELAATPDSNTRTVVKSLIQPESPKTASEILVQRIQEQQKRVFVKEFVNTADNLVEMCTSTNHTAVDQESSDGSKIISIAKETSEPGHIFGGQHISVLEVSTDKPEDNANHENSGVKEIDMNQEVVADVSECNQESNTIVAENTEVTSDAYQNFEESSDPSKSESVLTDLKNVEFNTETSVPDMIKSCDSVVDEAALENIKNNIGKIEKLKVLENGVEFVYDVRVVSEEQVTEEIVDNSHEMDQLNETKANDSDETPAELMLKEEVDDEDNETAESGKQTSGTQTVYSPQVETNASGAPLHTLTTVIDEEGQKKQIYYVSVISNHNSVGKVKQSTYSSAANCILNDNGMYCCGKCNYKTDRKANFYKHRRLHTGTKPHVCSICQYKAGTSSNLKRHMGIHKDIREHKCDTCGLCFRQKIHLERHVKYKHEEKSVQCPLCDYVCANEQPDLKMHIKRKHSSGYPSEVVTCPQCNIEVSCKKDLKQHMKFHKDGPELKLFCKQCSFVTDCQSRLKRHVAIHSKLKPFQCGVCNYRAAQKEHVLRHLRTQHKIEFKKESKRPWRRHKSLDTDDGSKEKADFSSGDKIFACNHCTMRFAKLINLYKHLHTQHVDIMPAETEGNYYCVVCEFSTSSKKNLLVHMRRHNLTDQTPPSHVYSCVLCRYINPKRRNLFQHMLKKHNIDVSTQLEVEDGASQDAENSDGTKHITKMLVSKSETNTDPTDINGKGHDLNGIAHLIKIEDIAQTTSSADEDVHNLVIDTRGDDNLTEVSHTAEALEGLQALAEQAGLIDNIIEEQVPVVDEQHIVIDPITSSDVVTTVDSVQQMFESVETADEGSAEVTSGVELSEDQLSSLRTGDMVEMDGELYVVELTQDASNPNKQILSFLPVNQTSVTQETHSS